MLCSITPNLWHEGLAEIALAAVGDAVGRDVPDAEAALTELEWRGGRSGVARAIVRQLALELTRRAEVERASPSWRATASPSGLLSGIDVLAEEPFDVVLPPELEEGSYAEQLSGWFTPEGFVLDFTARSRERELLVTSRVRLPATAAIEARRALDELIREYELEYGEIHRPRKRGDA